MKHILSIIILSVFLPITNIHAQTVEKGSIIIEGYAGAVSLGNLAWEKYADKVEGKYNLKSKFYTLFGGRLEYAFHDRFSAGIEYSLNKRELSWMKDDTTGVAPLVINPFKYTITQTIHRVMPRITAHMLNSEKVDLFASVAFGARIAKYDTQVDPDKPSWEFNWPGFNPIAMRFAIGVKYYPIKPVGLFVEIGTPGGNLFHGGLSIKI